MAALSKAVAEFDRADWQQVGIATGSLDVVRGHNRLLRAISFGDDDVPEAASEVLWKIIENDRENFMTIEEMVSEKQGVVGENISTAPSKSRPIVFTPSVFEVPDKGVDEMLVAVMMPFQPQFEPVFASIKTAARVCGGNAVRVKDIWEHQTIIQAVFSLIFRAQVVICDFSGRNPNVFYEAGIAHTLGKVVVPITQSKDDIPFDVLHHRYLNYLNNSEGLAELRSALVSKLADLIPLPF